MCLNVQVPPPPPQVVNPAEGFHEEDIVDDTHLVNTDLFEENGPPKPPPR